MSEKRSNIMDNLIAQDADLIAKPDPLVEAVDEGLKRWMETLDPLADSIRAAIEKRGGKIVWGEKQ